MSAEEIVIVPENVENSQSPSTNTKSTSVGQILEAVKPDSVVENIHVNNLTTVITTVPSENMDITTPTAANANTAIISESNTEVVAALLNNSHILSLANEAGIHYQVPVSYNETQIVTPSVESVASESNISTGEVSDSEDTQISESSESEESSDSESDEEVLLEDDLALADHAKKLEAVGDPLAAIMRPRKSLNQALKLVKKIYKKEDKSPKDGEVDSGTDIVESSSESEDEEEEESETEEKDLVDSDDEDEDEIETKVVEEEEPEETEEEEEDDDEQEEYSESSDSEEEDEEEEGEEKVKRKSSANKKEMPSSKRRKTSSKVPKSINSVSDEENMQE